MHHPDPAILQHFRVQLVKQLSSQRNQHWLVEQGQRQFVLRRWYQPYESIQYELALITFLHEQGWPVAPPLGELLVANGAYWSLAVMLPGEALAQQRPIEQQRYLGQLMARLHQDLSHYPNPCQRVGWRRCEAILADQSLDQTLAAHARSTPKTAAAMQWHLERARERVAELNATSRPGLVIHGDFTPWNLRIQHGVLTGILDFEMAHWDHRVAEFALAWRGTYDAVIAGYHELTPLEPYEWELLTPVWWAHLVEGYCRELQQGSVPDEWSLRMLLRRSPLMGPDARPYQARG